MVERNLAAVHSLCRAYGVRYLDLFGSAATGAFDEATSDLDFVALFANPGSNDYAVRYLDFAEGLEALFGRAVDLVTERSIGNPYFRAEVDAARVRVYDEQDAETAA